MKRVLNFAYIYAQMIRIRTTLLMGLFVLIGGLMASGRANLTLDMLWAFLAVAHLYIFGTCLNDLADFKIDKINLKNQSKERPLVKGNGSRRQLIYLSIISAVLSVILAWPLGLAALVLLGTGLVYAAIYSLPPVQLSHRGIWPPLTLPYIYVALPFLLAYSGSGYPLTRLATLLLVGLYLCFIGRIILKDVRDVKGDTRFGKRTFIVRYGMAATCITGATAWVGGSLLLLMYNWVSLAYVLSVTAIAGLIVFVFSRLAKEREYVNQLIYVATIGRLGNATAVATVFLVMWRNSGNGQLHYFILASTLLHIAMAYETFLYIGKQREYTGASGLIRLKGKNS